MSQDSPCLYILNAFDKSIHNNNGLLCLLLCSVLMKSFYWHVTLLELPVSNDATHF